MLKDQKENIVSTIQIKKELTKGITDFCRKKNIKKYYLVNMIIQDFLEDKDLQQKIITKMINS